MKSGTEGPKVLDHFTEGRIYEICPPGMALDYRGSLKRGGETLSITPDKVLLWLHDYPFAEAYLKEPPQDVFSLPTPGRKSPEPEVWPQPKEQSTGTSNLWELAVALIQRAGPLSQEDLVRALEDWVGRNRGKWQKETGGKMASARSIGPALSHLKALCLMYGIAYEKKTNLWGDLRK